MFLNLFFVIRTVFGQANYTVIFLSGRKSLVGIPRLNNRKSRVGFGTRFRLLHTSVTLRDPSSGNITIPISLLKNNGSCKHFTQFIHKGLLARLRSGAISLMGKVGYVRPPHLVLSLTVERGKPRLCHNARFLNLWMEDKPFTLDHLGDLPRYVSQDSYQAVLDDKSGYDHIFLSEDSRAFAGILLITPCPLDRRFRRLYIIEPIY